MKKFLKVIAIIAIIASMVIPTSAFATGYNDPNPPTIGNVYVNSPTSTGYIKTSSITFNLINVQDLQGVTNICATVANPDAGTSGMYWMTQSGSNWTKTINMSDFNYRSGLYNITYIIYDGGSNFTSYTYVFRYDNTAPALFSNTFSYTYQGGPITLSASIYDNTNGTGSGIRRVRFVLNKILPTVVPADCMEDAVYDDLTNQYTATLDTNYFGNTSGTYKVTIIAVDYAGNTLNTQYGTLIVP